MGNKVWLKRFGIAFAVWYLISSPIAAAHTVNSGGHKLGHAANQTQVFVNHLGK